MHLNSIVGIPFESTHARHMLPMPDHGSERPEQQRRARLFTIRAADSAGQRSSASILVNRMYAWRGYKNAELPKDENLANVLTVPSLTALLSVFCYFMFFGAVWAFLEPLGAQYGIDGRTVGLIVSASLAVQVLGAMTATAFEARIDYRLAIVAIGVIAFASSVVLASGPGLTTFWAAALVMGFILLFIVPYQIRLAIIADETRTAVLLVPAAQLFGLAIGPIAASLLIDGKDFRPVPEFAAASAVASVALLGLFVLVVRRGRAIA